MGKSYEIDMCHGFILPKILLFTIPLIFSSILQLLFNAVDMVVVGRYCGEDALAAVGSTGSLINLLTNLFLGLGIGANIMVARFYGSKQERELNETVQTSITSSILLGVLLAVIGIFLSGPLLTLMGAPENVLNQSVVYMKIYFLGMPALLLYNFGAAILRAIGDTRRPLMFLIIAGVINVLLNLFFVLVCNMGVAGVAWATIISQTISAALVFLVLMKGQGNIRFDIRDLRIYGNHLGKIMKIGLPAGLQGMLFSVSNVLIQSSINSFGDIAMAGNSACSNIEGFIYVSMNAFQQTALSFTSQNLGGGQYKRIRKVLLYCLASVTVVGIVLGNLAYYFGEPLLGIYNGNPEVIQYGMTRMSVIAVTYCICGIMDTLVGSIRGMGSSVLPMIISLLGACGFRIVWIYTYFQEHRSLLVLYISYPISWVVTSLVDVICFILVYRRVCRISKQAKSS